MTYSLYVATTYADRVHRALGSNASKYHEPTINRCDLTNVTCWCNRIKTTDGPEYYTPILEEIAKTVHTL